ncbi:MAG: PqqD family protein [Alistipes sp.]|nr:PqqD family protein [Alistipes sp.]
MKIRQGYKVREIAGENVVIMQGKAGADMTRIITFNDSALLLWNELQGKDFGLQDAVRVLTDNYEVDAAVAERDARAWIDRLTECKLVE